MKARVALRPVVAAVLLASVATVLPQAQAQGPTRGPASVTITTVSTRADLVTGGDVLLQVSLPAGARDLRVTVQGRDVTHDLRQRSGRTASGVITGLRLGSNEVVATARGARGARLALRNHSLGGPVLSGPQVTPWVCKTADAGLGAPLDAQCAARPVYDYFYKPVGEDGLKSYDPAAPPADVDSTTTDQGRTVPFVVRRERGALNRGVHGIAVLYDPAQATPLSAWNGKLRYPFGGACNTNHNQGAVPDVLDVRTLGKGFMVASSSLNALGQSCNTVVSAETVMMLKERIVEQYGKIRYTIGFGGSGGAIGQLSVANSYPGLLQGLVPESTFPDVWTTAQEVYDCHLLLGYFTATSPHLWTDTSQQAAVNGHEGVTSCPAWESLFAQVSNPEHGCGFVVNSPLPLVGVRTPQDYHPVLNPKGCRATVQDFQKAIWGLRSSDGFAKRPLDNVGVQCGLRALQDGRITVEQFLDLNEKIGGIDIDMRRVPERMVADPGTPAIAHRTGQANDGNYLDQVAIIDAAHKTNNEIHTPFHAFQVEERLRARHGNADNHAIWQGADTEVAFDTVDDWLTGVERDRSAATLPRKLLRARPATAVDSCFIDGKQVFDAQACRRAWPVFAEARFAAGAPVRTDIVACTRKAPARGDYRVAFTDAQWQRLRTAFPTGVCDWSRPGVGQVPSQPWMTFTSGPGGRPLGPAPLSRSEA